MALVEENWEQQILSARSLEYVGLSDPQLFDVIEANLLRVYEGNSDAPNSYAIWMTKALAFSGQPV